MESSALKTYYWIISVAEETVSNINRVIYENEQTENLGRGQVWVRINRNAIYRTRSSLVRGEHPILMPGIAVPSAQINLKISFK